MVNRSRPTQLKRQRERNLAEKRTQKVAKREEAKARRAATPPRSTDRRSGYRRHSSPDRSRACTTSTSTSKPLLNERAVRR